MRYIKYFESRKTTYERLNSSQYFEAIRTHIESNGESVNDESIFNSIKNSITRLVGKGKIESTSIKTDKTGGYRYGFYDPNDDYLHWTYHVYTIKFRDGKIKFQGKNFDKIDIILFSDEWILVNISIAGGLWRDIYALCDSREGLVDYLNDEIFLL